MKSITTRTAIITLEKENFVRMTMREDVYLDLKDMKDNHLAEQEIASYKPHVILIDTRNNSMSSDEARKYTSSDKPTKYRLALAIFFKDLSGRIGANSLINIYQPKVLTKKFEKESEAIKWLNNILTKVDIFTT
jgi:hypothetical protein